jgi:hypothetical protein
MSRYISEFERSDTTGPRWPPRARRVAADEASEGMVKFPAGLLEVIGLAARRARLATCTFLW